MQTISVMNAKGGVAKTTTSLCIASYLASQGKKVLFMDLDPQANASKTLLQLELGEAVSGPTLYDVLYTVVIEKRKTTVSKALKTITSNLDLLPAHQNMEPFKDAMKSHSRRPLDVLKLLVKPLVAQYDFLIMDCPADLSVYVENAIEMSDLILLPTTFDLYGLDGLALVIPVINEIRGDDFEDYRVFYTLYNSRATRIQQKIGRYADHLEEMEKVLPFKIPIDQSVKNSQADAKDLITDSMYRNSRARNEYTSLGNYILENWS